MTRSWSTPVTWAGGALAWVLGMVALRPLLGSDPLIVAAQWLIDAVPGSVATWAIETLGKDAQPTLVAGVVLGLVVASVVAGAAMAYLEPTRRWQSRVRTATALFVVLATAVGFRAAGGGLSIRWALASTFALVPPAALWLAGTDEMAPTGRRRALRGIGGAVGGVAVAGAVSRAFGGPGFGSGPQPGESLDPIDEKTAVGTTTPAPTPPIDRGALSSRREVGNVVISSADADADFGFSFAGMPARVGSASDHYVVDKAISTPRINTDEWSLTVEGSVDRQLSYSYSDLLDHPETREMTVTTVCISNGVGGGLIGTVDWRVVPVRALLSEAGVGAEAVDVVTKAADGYSEALPWSVVRDREDIVIAVGMDDGALPQEHGFPARLLVPGRYGMKSTKWVQGIRVKSSDHRAYWEQRGWDEEAVVNTLSYVRAIQRRGDRIAVGGVAYAGRRDVDRVEVSVDDGETWTDATLENPPSEHAWRRWRHVFDRPDRAPLDVVVRATDGEGDRQTSERTRSHPGGSTGWHSVSTSL